MKLLPPPPPLLLPLPLLLPCRRCARPCMWSRRVKPRWRFTRGVLLPPLPVLLPLLPLLLLLLLPPLADVLEEEVEPTARTGEGAPPVTCSYNCRAQSKCAALRGRVGVWVCV